MKYFLWILRIAVGLLFIFSGVVKANDPLGLTYKMNEFFEVWQMNYMINYTLGLSVLMIAFEIIAGVAVIVGNAFRLYITLLLLLNIFYTFLTGYALYSGKIKECGCFGDCIKISNTATFYKDVILTVMTMILYIFRYRIFAIFHNPRINASIVFVAALFAFGSQWWVLHHLPYHDCLPYKVGNNLWDKMQTEPGATQAEYETVLTYEKNGVKKDYKPDNIPWKDSTWKFVDSKSTLVKEATGMPAIQDFAIMAPNGDDETQKILTAKGYVIFWFCARPCESRCQVIRQDTQRNSQIGQHAYTLLRALLRRLGPDKDLPGSMGYEGCAVPPAGWHRKQDGHPHQLRPYGAGQWHSDTQMGVPRLS